MNAAAQIPLAVLLEGTVSSAPALLAEVVRELEAEDLLALAEPRGVQPVALKRVRTIHHQVAQMLATGTRPVEVAAATGYSLSRISILQADPLFQELQAFYTEQEANRFAELQDQIKALGQAVTEELLERVTSEEVSFMTNRDLRQIMEAALDRSGHSPVHRRQSMNVTLSGQELKELKERVNAKRTDKVVEVSIERDPPTGVGGAGGDGTARALAETTEGVESEG